MYPTYDQDEKKCPLRKILNLLASEIDIDQGYLMEHLVNIIRENNLVDTTYQRLKDLYKWEIEEYVGTGSSDNRSLLSN